MKQIIVIGLLLIFSCNSQKPQTHEEKIKAAVINYLYKNINDSTSYQPVEWGKIDSAFTSWDKMKEGIECNVNLLMLYYQDSMYKKDLNKYTFARAELKRIAKEIDVYESELNRLKKEYPLTFIGYNVRHNYRAKNEMGALVLTKMKFTIDTAYNVISTKDLKEQTSK